MTLFIHTHDLLYTPNPATGQLKTLTSRLVKPGDGYHEWYNTIDECWEAYIENNNRIKWHTGGNYAIQPGRGMKATGRYEVLALRQYDTRDITNDEARREGFENEIEFWKVWCGMYYKSAFNYVAIPIRHEVGRAREYLKQHLDHGSAIDDKFQAWQISFKVIERYEVQS